MTNEKSIEMSSFHWKRRERIFVMTFLIVQTKEKKKRGGGGGGKARKHKIEHLY